MHANYSHTPTTAFKGVAVHPIDEGTSRMSRQLRLELLDLALRDAVIRHSVPRAWVRADLITIESPFGTKWDVRLVIQQRDGLLWKHATDFHATFVRRLRLMDTGWKSWLADVIWQFPLPTTESSAPLAMEKHSSVSSAVALPVLNDIFIGVTPHVDGGSREGRSQTNAPQQIQLEKLREAMSSGDEFFTPEEGGHALDFQETRPFSSQA